MTSHITGQTLDSIILKSENSLLSNKKSDRLLNQLLIDSENITKSIALYREERKALAERRTTAITNYEAELEEIGDVSDTEDMLDENYGKSRSNSKVDHNLERIINRNKDDENFEDLYEYDDDFENLAGEVK